MNIAGTHPTMLSAAVASTRKLEATSMTVTGSSRCVRAP
jgi:hypothetical protein